ncbi:hypothetical protein BSKO_08813 [Bryopsis sp. KO-2023]|nr:hypothetical protein BSKO_08813 [Bryopsis sp. KO-2023]
MGGFRNQNCRWIIEERENRGLCISCWIPMRSVGFFSKLADKFKLLAFKQELVGIDQIGNKYYRYPDTDPNGKPVIKRIVDLADNEYDPQSIPPEWMSWLHRFRDEIPTEQEIERMKVSRDDLKRRVAALDEEEYKRRLRLESLQAEGMSSDGGPNMSKFVEELAAKGYGGGGDGGSSEPSHDSTEFKPETWTPGKS